MSGRRPGRASESLPSRPLRSPWLGEGKTLAAKRLSGVAASGLAVSFMRAGSGGFGREVAAHAALLLDRIPGGVDGREAPGRDRDRLLGQATGDLPVGMRLDDEAAVMPLQLGVIHLAAGAEDEIGIIGAACVTGLDPREIAVRDAKDAG